MSEAKKELIAKKIAEFMKGKPVPHPVPGGRSFRDEDNIADEEYAANNLLDQIYEADDDLGEPAPSRFEVIYLTCDWKPKK